MTMRVSINNILAGDKRFQEGSNFLGLDQSTDHDNQDQTADAFSNKWTDYTGAEDKESYYEMQRKWYLDLYGFNNEAEFSAFLKDKSVIYDAGCGLGFKAAWFAKLAPHATVIGMDLSEAARIAAGLYKDISNLYFIQGNIASSHFKNESIDYVSCDQVIMHTEFPDKTFEELGRITSKSGEFACYFYAKKALPRELLDDYFRTQCKSMSDAELKEMSAQLTELGKRLSELNIKINVPSIPVLGIKEGEMDVQRFIYWNFLKCYWNGSLGRETSVMINYDWYSPSNARRYSKDEVIDIITNNKMHIVTFHEEEACYSGRFAHKAKGA